MVGYFSNDIEIHHCFVTLHQWLRTDKSILAWWRSLVGRFLELSSSSCLPIDEDIIETIRFQMYPSKVLLIETSPNHHIHFRKTPNPQINFLSKQIEVWQKSSIHLQSYQSGKIKIISNKHNHSHEFQSILYFSKTNTNRVWLIVEANTHNRIAVSYINPDTVKRSRKGQNKLPEHSVVAGKRPYWLQNGLKGII